MKLLIIITTVFKLDGITNVVMNYYRHLNKSDMDIDFVVMNEPIEPFKCEIESSNSKIYVFKNRNKNPFSYIRELSRLISDRKYEIVHAHGNSCSLALEMYAAKMGGAKVRIPHSHNSTCEHLIAHRLLRRLFDKSYTAAFACGEKAGKWLFREKPFTIITNGIDIDRFSYNSSIREVYRKKLNLDGKKVIGHIGNFNLQKNHEFIVRVFDQLLRLDSSYVLLLVGDGGLKKSIEAQVNDLGITKSVIFLGKSHEVPQLLQTMDMFVMPSHYEGLPLTILEAQAACVSCIISDVITREVAITELVSFIALNLSPTEWAQVIHKKSLPDRSTIKEKTKNEIISAGYSIQDNAEKLKIIYEDLCYA